MANAVTTRTETVAALNERVEAGPSSNIGQALTDAGSNFGDLLFGIGEAVAITQQSLTETSADTTGKLAETLVQIPAVNETIYNDNGEIVASTTHTQLASALTIFDPVFYDYTQVRVQGQFTINQIATATSSSTSSSSSGGGLSLGFSSAFRGGGGFAASSSSSQLATSTDRVTAVGRVRMFSEMVPTPVIIPPPTQVVVGPSLRILEGPLTEDRDGTNVTARRQQVTIEFVKKNGTTPIAGKILSIETEGVPWSYDAGNATAGTPPAVVTDAQGRVTLTVERTFPLPEPDGAAVDTTPRAITLNVRRGLVNNNTVLNL